MIVLPLMLLSGFLAYQLVKQIDREEKNKEKKGTKVLTSKGPIN